MPNKYDNPKCCKNAELFVFWLEKVWNKLGKAYNPPKTGWCMATDDQWVVNVNFCPFCGKELLSET